LLVEGIAPTIPSPVFCTDSIPPHEDYNSQTPCLAPKGELNQFAHHEDYNSQTACLAPKGELNQFAHQSHKIANHQITRTRQSSLSNPPNETSRTQNAVQQPDLRSSRLLAAPPTFTPKRPHVSLGLIPHLSPLLLCLLRRRNSLDGVRQVVDDLWPFDDCRNRGQH